MDAADAEKRIKNLRKKLGQIEKLKEKDPSELDADARAKVESEAAIRQEIEELGGRPGAHSAPAPAAPAPTPAAAKPAAAKKAAKAPEPAVVEQQTPKPKAATPEPAEAPAPAPQPTGPSLEQEKRIKNLKKKLVQIEKLKEKSEALDADAQAKVASEPEILAEIACLERGEEYVPAAPAPTPQAAAAPKGVQKREDPLAAQRAAALEPPAEDVGLLLDDDTEKRFKTLQKTLRDIDKLRNRDKLDKLQEEKLTKEAGAIEELNAIRAKADAVLEARRNRYAPPARKEPKAEAAADSKGAAQKDEDRDDEDAQAKGAAEKARTYESADLKTNRQKKASEGAAKEAKEKLHEVTVSASNARWPEVRDVIESGDHGTDKGRQKKAIVVEADEAEPPYDVFDSALLRCGFLTRVELKLPPGVLMQETFQLHFPGSLCDNLVELILKGNKMTFIPPGLRELKRVRSIDVSHNLIEELPPTDTWDNISGSLELLDLSFNKLSSISELQPLTKLSNLKLDGNQVTSLDGVSWTNLKQLVTLTAVGNQIKEIPAEIAERADSLEHLDLTENAITVCPVEIVELRKLKSLSLAGCPIKDQKVVNNLSKGSNGLKDLKAYLSKIGTKGKRR